MTRKPRSDSVFEQVRVMSAAGKEILPPAHVPLSDEDIRFFNSVIAEFAKAEWTDHQLELAAMLARMMNDMEKEQRLLRSEGSILHTDRGTPVVSPRKTVVQMYSGSILSMRRSLSLHARAQGSTDVQKNAKRRDALKAIESDVIEDDLIARPN